MKKLLRLLTLVAGSALVTASWASQYAIQLEASKSPNLDRYQALSVHGKLYTVVANNGYTRTRLGPYKNKDQALAVLDKVHAAGYLDAFIAKHQSSEITTSSVNSKVAKQIYDIESFDVRTLKEWKMMTPEQQANLVYLDGELHIKNGDNFIPLDEITDEK